MSSYLGLSRFLLRFFSNSRMSSEVKSLSSLGFSSFWQRQILFSEDKLLPTKLNFHLRSASFSYRQTLLWKSQFQLWSFRGWVFLVKLNPQTKPNPGPSPHLKSSRIRGLDLLKAFKSMSMVRKGDTICALISTGLASYWRLRWWRAFDICLLSSACRSSTWWRQDHPWVIRTHSMLPMGDG
jgi:hypothetical protein